MLSRVAVRTAARAMARAPVVRPAVAFFSAETLVPGFGKGKTSTGIVGLPVDPDAVSKIIRKNQELLDRIAASDMPETAQYRIDVERIARYRIKVATENIDDPDKVEDLCQCGQVEELVQQADDEMVALDTYLSSRLWEHVAMDDEDDINIQYNPDPADDQNDIYDDEEEDDTVKT